MLQTFAKHVPKALAVGVDAICAQGTEAGGHTGDIATMPLIPQCVDACRGKTSPLHGGPIAAFLEISAIIGLSWTQIWRQIEDLESVTGSSDGAKEFSLPKTIDFSVDYLRSGLPRDAYARATVNRAGRRYASVHVEAWQDNRNKLFAQGTGHFLMPLNK